MEPGLSEIIVPVPIDPTAVPLGTSVPTLPADASDTSIKYRPSPRTERAVQLPPVIVLYYDAPGTALVGQSGKQLEIVPRGT